MVLTDPDIFYARAAPRLQINIPEDPRIYELRAPVPAEHGMCFSQNLVSLHASAGHILHFSVFTVLIFFYIFKG